MAILQPVLNAGSHPKTVLFSIGLVRSSCSRFFEKTLIDLSSASSFKIERMSLSIAGLISLLYESSMESSIISSVYLFGFIVWFAIYCLISSSSVSILIF